MSLAHSTVVILGGSSGIGLATAKAAKAEGARVVVTGRSADRLKSAKTLLGADARTVALDVADEAGTRALFQELDRVDHVFITAGIVVLDSGLAPDSTSLRPALDTRFWGRVRRGQVWRRQDAGRRVHHFHVRDHRPAAAQGRCGRDRLVRRGRSVCPRARRRFGADSRQHNSARVRGHADARRTARRSARGD